MKMLKLQKHWPGNQRVQCPNAELLIVFKKSPKIAHKKPVLMTSLEVKKEQIHVANRLMTEEAKEKKRKL